MQCIFDLIWVLYTLEMQHVSIDVLEEETIPNCVVALAAFEGFFPIVEMQSTKHQLVHSLNDIKRAGPSRNLWMFPFERFNKYLKGLIFNQAHPLASMAKNYSIFEKFKMHMCGKYDNFEKYSKLYDNVPPAYTSALSDFMEGMTTCWCFSVLFMAFFIMGFSGVFLAFNRMQPHRRR